MIINRNDEDTRHKVLMEAFDDSGFMEVLKKEKEGLEEWIKEWVGQLPPFDLRIDNVTSIESRVKSKKAFEEKLFRKNYIKEWEVTDDILNNQNLIKQKMTDLIGLRVNCHFVNQEENIFNFFFITKQVQEKKGFSFNFDENKSQKNGNRFFKFSGITPNKVHFEVQIKSIVHNVWGEIEHRIVYKNPTYDGFFDEKKRISQTLHDVMLASDKELHILFNMKESQEQLLRSLFFCQTSQEISTRCSTPFLGEHYNTYFLTFPDIEPIKRYVVSKLSNSEYERIEIKIDADDFYHKLSNEVKNLFPSFFIKCLFHIDSIIHIHPSYDSFLLYFLKNVIHNDVDEFDNAYSYDFNGQDELDKDVDTIVKDSLIKIDGLLGTRIFKEKYIG